MKIKFYFQRVKEYLKHGEWRERLTLYEAVALMVGATVGAGILGIPYAVSKVGVVVGVVYILALGLLIAGINLMVGEVSARTMDNLQIVGLTRKYVGKKGGLLMMFLFYIQLFAIIAIYIIAEGEILASLFPGSSFFWSIVFWLIGGTMVYFGLEIIKKAEVFLTLAIIIVILVIAFLCFPYVDTTTYKAVNMAYFFMPYGVILFAFSGLGTIPAAYRLLYGNNFLFKKAIIISSLVSITIYTIFTILVIGVTGTGTTEIATIGLGQAIGKVMFYMANIFALLAMSTSFLMLSMELRDSLNWDFNFPYRWSTFMALGIPMAIFLAGARQFILLIDIVGGIIISGQMFLIIYVYWRAKKEGDIEPSKYTLHYTFLVASIALIAFFLGAASSFYGIIN